MTICKTLACLLLSNVSISENNTELSKVAFGYRICRPFLLFMAPENARIWQFIAPEIAIVWGYIAPETSIMALSIFFVYVL